MKVTRSYILSLILLSLANLPLSTLPVTGFGVKSYQTVVTESITLVNETYNVPLRSIRYLRIYIDISEKIANNVSGSVKTNGKNINFYVFDQDEFFRWTGSFTAGSIYSDEFVGPFGGSYNNYLVKKFSAYLFVERDVSYEYSFIPNQTDHYYFVFDNYRNEDWQTNKMVQITVVWTYQVTATSEEAEGSPVNGSGSTSTWETPIGIATVSSGWIVAVIVMAVVILKRRSGGRIEAFIIKMS